MASIYWRWTWPSGDQRAYKQRFDPTCAMPVLAKINSAIAEEDNCVGCHKRISGAPDVVIHAHVYVPGREELYVQMPYDDACLQKDESIFETGAERLLDRPMDGGAGPRAPIPDRGWEAWELAHQAST
jgi:hypothetical protein